MERGAWQTAVLRVTKSHTTEVTDMRAYASLPKLLCALGHPVVVPPG